MEPRLAKTKQNEVHCRLTYLLDILVLVIVHCRRELACERFWFVSPLPMDVQGQHIAYTLGYCVRLSPMEAVLIENFSVMMWCPFLLLGVRLTSVDVDTSTMKSFGHSIKNGHLIANTEITLFEHVRRRGKKKKQRAIMFTPSSEVRHSTT